MIIFFNFKNLTRADFDEYRLNHPGPKSTKAFQKWKSFGGKDAPWFKWRVGRQNWGRGGRGRGGRGRGRARGGSVVGRDGRGGSVVGEDGRGGSVVGDRGGRARLAAAGPESRR